MTGWKTALAVAIVGLVGVAETFIKSVDFVNEETGGYVLMGTSLLFGALRAITKTPIFQGK